MIHILKETNHTWISLFLYALAALFVNPLSI